MSSHHRTTGLATHTPSNANPMLWFQTNTDRGRLLALYRSSQNPASCRAARYLVIDDFESRDGMGYTFLILQSYLQQAVAENRVLIFASAMATNSTWRWCAGAEHGPMDFSCYFEPWTRCERYFTERTRTLNVHRLPRWNWDVGLSAAPIVYLEQKDDSFRSAQTTLYRYWDSACCSRRWNGTVRNGSLLATPMGKSWWFGTAWDVLLKPKPFFERRANDFLASKGVGPNETFIVAAVRHGGKHIEQQEIAVREYLQPIRRLTHESCIGTRHVLLITETLKVVKDFSHMCAQNGWNCFYSDQDRTDNNFDAWNPTNRHRQSTADNSVLEHIGWHSVLNLVASRRGAAIVGSLQSQWVLMSATMMHRYHGSAVTVCSLRLGWRSNHFYDEREDAFVSENCQRVFPSCTQPYSRESYHAPPNDD